MAKHFKKPQFIALYLLAVISLVLLVAWIVVEREKPVEEIIFPPDVIPETEVAVKPKIEGRIILIIDDFGYGNDYVTKGYLSIDADLTFAIIPGHTYSQSFARDAINAGYEVIVHMPMESHTKTKGEEEYVLETSMTSKEIENRVEKVFNHLPEATGMNNHQGSKATEDERVMSVLASVLKRRMKYFIDSRTTAKSVAEKTMRYMGVITNHRNVFLDNDDDQQLIKDQIDKLKRMAKKYGNAIGIGHARVNTMEVLKTEIPAMIDEGYSFQFVSTVIK